MKRLKGLMRMEYQAALGMSIYFLLVNVMTAIIMLGEVNRGWSRYLENGINGFFDWRFTLDTPLGITFAYAAGIVVLVYIQFRSDKSIEISRFIKALPYTNEERGLVKVILGLLSFTIPYIVFVCIYFGIKRYTLNLYSEIYNVTAYRDFVNQLNTSSTYIQFIAFSYLKIVTVYMLFVMYEYLMSHNLGSIIAGICTTFAPGYVIFSLLRHIEGYHPKIEKISNGISGLYVGFIKYKEISSSGARQWRTMDYPVVNHLLASTVVYSIILVIVCGVVVYQINKQRTENADILIPGKFIRWIFVAGVAVCTGCLVKDIICVICTQAMLQNNNVIRIIAFIIGLLIGGVISFKISRVGLRKKGEV